MGLVPNGNTGKADSALSQATVPSISAGVLRLSHCIKTKMNRKIKTTINPSLIGIILSKPTGLVDQQDAQLNPDFGLQLVHSCPPFMALEANLESCFSVLADPQPGQGILAVDENTSSSNLFPQSAQTYSNKGILICLL
jgi:hypothetical protein